MGKPMPSNASPAPRTRQAVVLGVNGQDGSYLAGRLLDLGWAVCGVGRQPESRWLPPAPGFRYAPLDLSQPADLAALLDDVRPQAVFHFAAVHGSAGFIYEDHWPEVHAVNTVSAHAVLEYQRKTAPDSVFVYASSSKVFGPELPACVSETSPRRSTCIYTTTKNAATDLIAYYRQRHGTKASVVWTFNHESPRRGDSYFVPRIVDVIARALLDRNHVASIGTLGFWSDWGDAAEFMDLVATIATAAPGRDFLLATGTTLWAEDAVDALFGHYGLDRQKHLIEAAAAPGARPQPWRADVSALAAAIGRRPLRTIHDVAADMLRLNHPQAWEQACTTRAKT